VVLATAVTRTRKEKKNMQKISDTRVSRVAFGLQNGQNRLIPYFPVKIGLFWGVGGVPEFFLLLESSCFCYLGAHAKILNPTTTPSGVFSNGSNKKTTTTAQRRSDQ
jgi:hypothetical protein